MRLILLPEFVFLAIPLLASTKRSWKEWMDGRIKQDHLVNRRFNFQNEVNNSFKIFCDVSALKNEMLTPE